MEYLRAGIVASCDTEMNELCDRGDIHCHLSGCVPVLRTVRLYDVELTTPPKGPILPLLW